MSDEEQGGMYHGLRRPVDPDIQAELDRAFGELDAGVPTDAAPSPLMEMAEQAAARVADWSASKQEYAARVMRPQRKAQSPAPPSDMVNLPQHYARFKFEPVRFLVENNANPFQFNIVKYVMRAEHKHETPFEDIKKVLRMAEMYFKYLKGDEDWWKPTTMSIPGYYP